MSRAKTLKPMYQELINQGKEVFWNFAALAYPSSAESPYTFASVIQLPNMKSLLDEPNLEEAFKKTMPGVDRKQFYKELDDIRHFSRQEVYYLMEYALKTPASKLAIQLDPAKLDAYVGVYEGPFRDNPKATFTVKREGNQLFEELTGGQNLAILPQTETKFVFREMDAQLEFIKDGSGKVIKRTLTYDGKTTEAKKIK